MSKAISIPTAVINAVAAQTQQTKKQVRLTLLAALSVIAVEAAAGHPMMFKGFGTFYESHRKSRKYRLFGTNADATVPARTVLAFRPAKAG